MLLLSNPLLDRNNGVSLNLYSGTIIVKLIVSLIFNGNVKVKKKFYTMLIKNPIINR